MSKCSFDGDSNTVLFLSPREAFIVRKALRKYATLVTRQSDADTATAIIEEMEKD